MDRLGKLKDHLASFEKVLVAFSGGVDSSTLAAVAAEVTDVLAVTVSSPLMHRSELRDAKRIAAEIGVRHRILDIDLLSFEGVAENREDRCYHCKRIVLSRLIRVAEMEGCDAVIEGSNASDGERPGLRAVRELGVVSPWFEFGFTKDEIRSIARQMGFSFWSKPSNSCLATRIPYGVPLSEELLRKIETAEEVVKDVAGVGLARVRVLRSAAIVEVEKEEVVKVLKPDVALKILNRLLGLGFETVLLDLAGYSPGKLYRYT